MDPQFNTETHTPDQLFAGDFPVRTRDVVIVSSAALKRGAVLGVISDGGKYKLSATAAGDGSETPKAILAKDADASEGDAKSIVYLTGDFNEEALTFGAGHDAASVRETLRALSIFLHKPVKA